MPDKKSEVLPRLIHIDFLLIKLGSHYATPRSDFDCCLTDYTLLSRCNEFENDMTVELSDTVESFQTFAISLKDTRRKELKKFI